MPPKVATFICIAFIICLFLVERKEKSNNSIWLWIPTIWVMILGSRMVSQWFDIGSSGTSSDFYLVGSAFDRNIFLVLILTALTVLIKRKIAFSGVVSSNKWIFFYLIYCAISILWSDYPFVSLKRYVKEFGNLAMVLIVLSENDRLEAIRKIMDRCSYILIPLSILLFKYYPALGRGYGIWEGELHVVGVTNAKNSLGALCLVSGISLTWGLISRWQRGNISADRIAMIVRCGMLAMTVWLLIKANSATSIGCFIIGIFILMVTRVEAVRKQMLKWTLFAIMGLILIFSIVDVLPILTAALGRDETLTTRTEVWGSIIELVKNPIIGTGYRSFWLGERLNKLWEEYWWQPTEAHNGYIEIYIELGLIGLILFFGIIVSSLRSIVNSLNEKYQYGLYRFVFFVIAIMYNITEAAFRVDMLMYFVFFLVAINYSAANSEASKA